MIGPVQFMVGILEEPQFSGAIIEALAGAREKGAIRLIDAMGIGKDENGDLVAVEISDYTEDEAIEFGAMIGALMGLGAAGEEGMEAGAVAGAFAVAENDFGESHEQLVRIAQEMPPGKVAIILMIEHVWAKDLKYAFRSQGGVLVAQGMITPESLVMVGATLREMVEATEEMRQLQG
jgi:uncharacterized membrane protein